MANLPANRTKLNVAIANQQPSIVASSQANREALVESYDTIDLLNQKVDKAISDGTPTAYTAADVLAKLLTVDGVGSGLDADKFAGMDLTRFIFGESLRGVTTWKTGIDNINKSGFFYVNTDRTNTPTNADCFVIQASDASITSGNSTTQLVIPYGSNRIFQRVREAGSAYGQYAEFTSIINGLFNASLRLNRGYYIGLLGPSAAPANDRDYAFTVNSSGDLLLQARDDANTWLSDLAIFKHDKSFVQIAGVKVCGGNGSPEGVITAGTGALYMRWDGGASTTLYIKTSGAGNTGWTAK